MLNLSLRANCSPHLDPAPVDSASNRTSCRKMQLSNLPSQLRCSSRTQHTHEDAYAVGTPYLSLTSVDTLLSHLVQVLLHPATLWTRISIANVIANAGASLHSGPVVPRARAQVRSVNGMHRRRASLQMLTCQTVPSFALKSKASTLCYSPTNDRSCCVIQSGTCTQSYVPRQI